MKVTIQQNLLSRALECGGVAAISEEAKNDNSNIATLIKSVKITVDSNFTVESSNKLISLKYTIPIDSDCGIDVKETGCIVVPAKEFIQWVDKQGDSKIGISLSKLDNPEDLDEDNSVVKKVGTVKFASKDASGTGNRWSLDCYDPSQGVNVDFDQKPEMLFEANAEQIMTGNKYVSIASLPKHHEKIFDSVSFEVSKDILYMATTDTTRCAVYKVEQSTVSDKMKNDRVRILVQCKFLDVVSKLFDTQSKISFYYDNVREHVFIVQPNFEIRAVVADKASTKKFPSVEPLINKTYIPLCKINREMFLSRIDAASMVNKNTVLFKFSKDENNMVIKAISEVGLAPSMSVAPVVGLSCDKRFVWAVEHVAEIIKLLKDDEIKINVPDKDNGSFKITNDSFPNFLYFGMSVNNPKYSQE